MKRKVLVLCDREREYAGLMGDYLKKQKNLPWEIHVYTEPGQISPGEGGNEIGLLVVAESAYSEELKKMNSQKTVILNEGMGLTREEVCSVNKYQRAENVVRELLEACVDTFDAGFVQMKNGLKTKFIGMYSPVRRCMQTTFALTFAQMMAQEHKTLYLNFEHYAGLTELLPEFCMKDLADLLYYMNEDREKFFLRMQSIVRKKGELAYIPPMKSGQNLLTVTKEEWIRLIRTIDEVCEYEYVIMDLTDSMQGLFEILRYCDKIYTITHDDRMAKCKIDQYEKILALYQYEDVLNKTKRCDLPKLRRIPEEISQYTKTDLAEYIRALM